MAVIAINRRATEDGNVLLGVIILVAVSAIMVATALDFSATASRTGQNEKVRTREYYQSEQTLGLAASWLRANSKNLTSVFNRSNFYNTFDRTAPGFGTNDTSSSQVHTKIKLQGTNESVILANNPALATSRFPDTTNTATGSAFSPLSEFDSSYFGSDLVRITLIDALPVDPSKDYGDPDSGNAPPQTDFYPVYRIDAMHSTTSGAAVYGFVVGNLIYDYGIGFYGRDYFEMRQTCDSYLSANGPYSPATRRANCTTGSNGEIRILQTETLHGSAQTNGTINSAAPFGGPVCSNFLPNCPNRGLTCEGASCSVPPLPMYGSWGSYCPTNRGDVASNSDDTLTVPGNNAHQKCWDEVEIANGQTLTLTSTAFPYFFNTLYIRNTGKLKIEPNPNTGTITIYVNRIVGDSFNGNQIYNVDNRPHQLRIHYLGNSPLTLNGTVEMRAFLVAPNAGVTVSGNFSYSGGIRAASLTMTGNGDVHYDESGDVTTLGDTQYTLKNIIQRYR